MVACLAAVCLLVLTNSALAADVTLAWDPNSEIDMAGYGVYFQKFPPDQQYDLNGYIALEELGDSNTPTLTVSALDLGSQYQFAVTAYDTAGNESSFSIPVCAEIGTINVAIACPSSVDGSGSGGGGGGGGGGCFIRSISGGPDVIVLPVIVLSPLWLFVSFWRIKNKAS